MNSSLDSERRNTDSKKRQKKAKDFSRKTQAPKIVVNNNIMNSMVIGNNNLSKVIESLSKKTTKQPRHPAKTTLDKSKKGPSTINSKFMKYKQKLTGPEEPSSNLMREALIGKISKMLSKQEQEVESKEFSRVDEFLYRASLEQKANAGKKIKARLSSP